MDYNWDTEGDLSLTITSFRGPSNPWHIHYLDEFWDPIWDFHGNIMGLGSFGGFHSHGATPIASWFLLGKTLLKWMITGGTPILEIPIWTE